MKRSKIKEIEKWFNSENRKPLIVWGARQVGKTHLLKNEFASGLKDFLYIDLIKDDEARKYFDTTCDAKKYLEYIETRFNKKISNECPLIFDEVQTSLNVITSLKYFEQDFKNLPIIATGSMVRVAIKTNQKEDFLFPVGKINSINVYPLTFDEYLLNVNEKLIDRIRECYKEKTAMQSFEHEVLMEHLYRYLSIGGMPEALDIFIKTGSYVDANKVLNDIYDNYLNDMAQYNVSNETLLKTRNVYNNIFNQLNKENKNFKISLIDSGKSNRDYFNAYEWLLLSKVVYKSSKLEGKIAQPIMREEGKGLFRLYLADEGLFTNQSKVNRSDFFVKDNRNRLSGVFYENYVACELSAKDIELFYWCGKNENEFEFIVEKDGDIIPIDVKKNRGKLNSLVNYRNVNSNKYAIKISANNFGYDEVNGIYTIPLYATFALAEDIRNCQ